MEKPAVPSGVVNGSVAGLTANPAIGGGKDSSPAVTPVAAPRDGTSITSVEQGYVVPDWFHQPADGADAAPEIIRAQATGKPLRFGCHHYAINSPVSITTLANWRGCGWQSEPTASVARAAGTWLDIGPAFIDAASAPITITGANATGSLIEDVAVDEPGMTTSPAAVTNSRGQTTGWKPTIWSPAPYTEVFRVNGAPDVTFRHVFFEGVNAGISETTSGRARTEDIRGQAFSYLISVQDAYDVSRIIDVHEWPFWSQADPVIQYQQAHTQTVISSRNDTPFWDRIFAFGVLDGVAIMSSNDGSTSGAAVGTVSCDFTRYCIHVYAGASNVNAQVSNVRTYGQKWDTVSGDPVAMLPGSSLVQVDGVAILQIGQAESYGTDKAIVAFTNASGGSAIYLNSLLGHIKAMSPGASVVTFPPTGSPPSVLTINHELLIPPSQPDFTQTNTGANGSGVATLQTATYVTQH